MKIVLSGGTGYIGSAVLSHCIQHPSVTSILVLTRRDLGDLGQNPKVETIIVQDFTSYDEATAEELKTADAALWCLGTTTGDERVDIDYPLHFIDIIKARPQGSKHFRYVQLSGALTEPPPKEGEQQRSLWFYTNGRRVRGATEAKVMETTDNSPQSQFTVYLVKPGGVLSGYGAMLQYIFGDSWSIGMDELTATMVDLAVNGNEKKTLSNREIIEHGRNLRKQSK